MSHEMKPRGGFYHSTPGWGTNEYPAFENVEMKPPRFCCSIISRPLTIGTYQGRDIEMSSKDGGPRLSPPGPSRPSRIPRDINATGSTPRRQNQAARTSELQPPSRPTRIPSTPLSSTSQPLKTQKKTVSPTTPDPSPSTTSVIEKRTAQVPLPDRLDKVRAKSVSDRSLIESYMGKLSHAQHICHGRGA